MENPILNQLSNMGTIPTTQMGTTGISNTIVPQQMQQIKNTINMLKSSKDPQSLMNYLSASGSNVTPFAFSTLVQVSSNNTSCCCSAPTEVNIINTGAAATFAIVDVAVTKVC